MSRADDRAALRDDVDPDPRVEEATEAIWMGMGHTSTDRALVRVVLAAADRVDPLRGRRETLLTMHSADSAQYCRECERPSPCATSLLLRGGE